MSGFLSERSSGRRKFNPNAAGRIGNIADSWEVLDTDTDAPKLSYEPAEIEVEAPLDVRAQGSFQISTSNVISTFICLSTSCFLPSLYRSKKLFGQLETLLDIIRDSRTMMSSWNG